MKVTVEFKANFAQLTGHKKLDITINHPARVIDLIQVLTQRFSNLLIVNEDMKEEELRSQMLVLHGNDIVFMDYLLSDGDVIAIYPPLSGG